MTSVSERTFFLSWVYRFALTWFIVFVLILIFFISPDLGISINVEITLIAILINTFSIILLIFTFEITSAGVITREVQSKSFNDDALKSFMDDKKLQEYYKDETPIEFQSPDNETEKISCSYIFNFKYGINISNLIIKNSNHNYLLPSSLYPMRNLILNHFRGMARKEFHGDDKICIVNNIVQKDGDIVFYSSSARLAHEYATLQNPESNLFEYASDSGRTIRELISPPGNLPEFLLENNA